MKFFIHLTCTLFISFILFSCRIEENDPECGDPPPNWFQIGFFDTQDNPLIGNVYTQDSFRLYNTMGETYLKTIPFGSPSYLQVIFDSISSDSVYYIELSQTDTDTLSFEYEKIDDQCFSNYYLRRYSFNGLESTNLNNQHIIIFVK